MNTYYSYPFVVAPTARPIGYVEVMTSGNKFIKALCHGVAHPDKQFSPRVWWLSFEQDAPPKMLSVTRNSPRARNIVAFDDDHEGYIINPPFYFLSFDEPEACMLFPVNNADPTLLVYSADNSEQWCTLRTSNGLFVVMNVLLRKVVLSELNGELNAQP